ncbi:MAG: TatD family hydrolase [Thermoanaerobaculia bacterium]
MPARRRLSSIMQFTDSHCHLTPQNANELLTRARAAGVRGFVVPATDAKNSPDAIAVAEQHEDVWCAVGFHPHEAKDCDDAALAEIERLAKHEKVVAIGECGLDYHYDHSPREVQRQVFARHIDLAKRTGKPIIVHNRESTADLLEMLPGDVPCILHSFTESAGVARTLLDRGAFISFSGIATFRTAQSIRDAAAIVPHDRALIETDTPYLAPVPYRGRENEPAYVVKIAELLADVWRVPLERVAAATSANFESVFSVRLPR